MKRTVKDSTSAIGAYFKAFALVSKLKLWKAFVVPLTIGFIMAVLIFFTAYVGAHRLGDLMSGIWKWSWGKATFTAITHLIASLLIIIVGLILYRHSIIALTSPFMGVISEKIEAHITGVPVSRASVKRQLQRLCRGFRMTLRNLFMELLLTVPILLLGGMPVLGFVSIVLLLLLQAYYTGFGNIDYTLERHLKYRRSIAFVEKRRGLAIGNGIVFILLLFIPVIGIFLALPLSVTAASLTTVEALQLEDKISRAISYREASLAVKPTQNS